MQNSTINVNGGLLTSSAAGGNFQNVNLNSGGTINPGGISVVGPITIANLVTASGGILQFDTATGNSADQIIVGSLAGGSYYTFGAGTIINPVFFGQLSTIAGTYNLIDYGRRQPGPWQLYDL